MLTGLASWEPHHVVTLSHGRVDHGHTRANASCLWSVRGCTYSGVPHEGPKPYEFIGFGDIEGPKPYEFIGLGDIHDPKLYEFIRLGDIDGPCTLAALWEVISFFKGSDIGHFGGLGGPGGPGDRYGAIAITKPYEIYRVWGRSYHQII